MTSLLKLMLILALIFASTFLLANATDLITPDKLRAWLVAATEVSALTVALIVIGLLVADLFIAVPTLTVMLLAGYFLGHGPGAVAVITGLSVAGLLGYGLSRKFGDPVVRWLIKDEAKRAEAAAAFQAYGVVTILLSRAVPILPEVSACLAGITRMPFGRFILAWLASTVPYTVIASYAGSISTLDNPQPAIFTAIGLTAFFWIAWALFRRHTRRGRTV